MEKYRDESLDFKERARDMVSRMTVEELAGQMLYGAAKIERLGVQFYNWWNEGLHGVARAGMATVFPQAIGLAAAFDDGLVGEMAEAIADEGRAKYNEYSKWGDYDIYKGLTYWSPNVNIFRDPRWGRGQETYGEDPYLTAKLGVAFVKGLQGNDPRYLKLAACAKHFAVHSGPEKIRHEFDAVVSDQDLWETYLPAFKALCDAGVEGFMGAYNRTNGEPCCGSESLQKILREEWGFDGYFTSDCWAIADFHEKHQVTKTATESVALAVKNGCDLNCGNLYGMLLSALDEGLITEEMLRECVTRLITTRMRLGMFDEKTPFDGITFDVVECEKHQKLNLELSKKSLVLLKNNGVLPLNKTKLKNVAVIGPNADSIVALNGNYHGTANEYITVLEGIREALPGVRVNYTMGSHLYKKKIEPLGFEYNGLAEAKILASHADAVVLVVGLDETIEGEEMQGAEAQERGEISFSGDKNSLYLPETQRRLIRELCDMGKPVILVNMAGSAIDFEYGNDHADAIIQAWYPGAMGGRAIAQLIFGDYSPSGKLPVTFYRNDNKLPEFTDYSMEGRTYKFFQEKPLYPFGYGLSYTSFAYSGLTLSADSIGAGEGLTATVTVKNTGRMDGDEVVELYIKDNEASVRVPQHKLCGFQRVFLKAGESKTLTFTLDKSAMELTDKTGAYQVEPGVFTLYAGGSQPDEYSQSLGGGQVVSKEFTVR